VRQNDVRAWRGHRSQAESHGVRAKLLIQLYGVEAGTLGLRHFLAAAGTNQRMQIDSAKRHLAGHMHAKHDHASNPEKEDVVAGDKKAGRVVAFEIRRLFRPTERGKGPQAGAEPCIEHIRVLLQIRRPALRAFRGWLRCDRYVAILLAVPSGDPVSPPK